MPRHKDFEKIYRRFIKEYGSDKGKDAYYSWINKKGYDDTKPFPKKEGKKEKMCSVIGVEVKELPKEFHVEGLIATSHLDDLGTIDPGIPDMIPKETLDSFAAQINTEHRARVMGVHHSEGRSINPEVYGEADIEKSPAKVIELSDGEFGLYVDTKIPKGDTLEQHEKASNVAKAFQNGDLNSFSITFDTNGFMTTDFGWVDNELVRILQPDTRLFGYTGANNPVNPNAVATGYGYKEFKELVKTSHEEVISMKTKETKEETATPPENENEAVQSVNEQSPGKAEKTQSSQETQNPPAKSDAEKTSEEKEFQKWKAEKKEKEQKEMITEVASEAVTTALGKYELKEKAMKGSSKETKELPLEIKEHTALFTDKRSMGLEVKEQFRIAGAACDKIGLDPFSATTSRAENREFKDFGTSGTKLEYKGLGITTNQNEDTDYLQSSAELQDIYDPVIYNALNQATVTWALLAKDDYSNKGNNMVQFTLKTAANVTAAFYGGNSVTTGNVTRLKYQTKFKKLQVGVSVDGDMIAAARGGPVSDVFAQEVMDSTMDMLAVLNAALFGENGAETDDEILGFEYITDSAGNTTLYSLTRSSTNKLSPDSAADTYINQSSAIISMTNLRAGIRQAKNEGANKSNLVWITNPVQGDMLRGKFDDSRRMLTSKNTDFGFSTDLFVDGVPVFEDKDCNTDDWFLVDLETHRVAIWVPPTIERLGKSADNEEAFVKMYFATYNRAPRRMVQIYGCSTS